MKIVCVSAETVCEVRQSKLASASTRAGAPVERLSHSRCAKRASRSSGELNRRATASSSAPSTLMQKMPASRIGSWLLEERFTHTSREGGSAETEHTEVATKP